MRKQFVGFQIRSEVVEVFHVREDIELFVALKEVVASGEVGEHTLREATLIPVDTPQPVAAKIVMECLSPTLVEANLKNFKRNSDRAWAG